VGGVHDSSYAYDRRGRVLVNDRLLRDVAGDLTMVSALASRTTPNQHMHTRTRPFTQTTEKVAHTCEVLISPTRVHPECTLVRTSGVITVAVVTCGESAFDELVVWLCECACWVYREISSPHPIQSQPGHLRSLTPCCTPASTLPVRDSRMYVRCRICCDSPPPIKGPSHAAPHAACIHTTSHLSLWRIVHTCVAGSASPMLTHQPTLVCFL